MRKLKLDVETITVESFAALPEPQASHGTVRGAATNYANASECDPSFCVQASCDWTFCANMTCQGYCGGGGTGGGGGQTDEAGVATCGNTCLEDPE